MPIFLTRVLARLALLGTWWTPVLVFALVFLTSWPLMALAEPAGSEIVAPGNYWWYFVVTASTVGYGDLYPETAAGHVVGAYVIAGGIATLTTVFTRFAATLERARGRRMRGAVTVDMSGHIVLLGYTPGRTEQMVDELTADGSCRIVLCAWDEVQTHPMPEREVTFVRGDLTDDKVLLRAVSTGRTACSSTPATTTRRWPSRSPPTTWPTGRTSSWPCATSRGSASSGTSGTRCAASSGTART